MRVLVTALFVLLSGAAHGAGDGWTGGDTAMLGAALGMLAVDWNQSRKVTYEEDPSQTIYVNGRRHREANPLLGGQPSAAEVNRYFIASMAATAGIAYVLPPTWRRVFLGAVIVTEAAVIVDNERIGLRFSF